MVSIVVNATHRPKTTADSLLKRLEFHKALLLPPSPLFSFLLFSGGDPTLSPFCRNTCVTPALLIRICAGRPTFRVGRRRRTQVAERPPSRGRRPTSLTKVYVSVRRVTRAASVVCFSESEPLMCVLPHTLWQAQVPKRVRTQSRESPGRQSVRRPL